MRALKNGILNWQKATLFVCAAILVSACSQNSGPATVKVTMPSVAMLASNKTIVESVSSSGGGSSGGGSSWGLSAPTTLSQVNCFGIMVGASTGELGKNTCTTTDGKSFFVGKVAGLVAPGSSISVSAPSGPARTFTLIGFSASSGFACEGIPDPTNPQINQTNYSPPMVLAQLTSDLKPGDNTINMKAVLTGNQVKDCNFGNTGTPGNSNPNGNTINVGSGADGDISISAPTSLDQILSPSSSRYLTTTARVVGLEASGTGRYIVSIARAVDSTHFGVGDEVMLYIAAEYGINGCGSDGSNKLSPGFMVQGKITTAAASSTMAATFDDPRVGQISSTYLSYPATQGSAFCRATITRIPQVNNLTLSSSGILTAPQFGTLGGSDHLGGILALRVKGAITVPSGSTGAINVDGLGYAQNGTMGYQGDSIGGAGSSAVGYNYNSGGGITMTASGAAGGSNGGLGLEGASNTGQTGTGGALQGNYSGDPYGCSATADSTMQCLIGKIFFGGAGGKGAGGGTSYPNGGGIIYITADQINIPASATLLLTSAGSGGNGYTAAGAGGSILVRANTLKIDSGGNLSLKAPGGSVQGISGPYGMHGAGGGGRVHLDIQNTCSTSTGAVSQNVTGGNSVPFSGTTRTAGLGTFYKSGSGISSATCIMP